MHCAACSGADHRHRRHAVGCCSKCLVCLVCIGGWGSQVVVIGEHWPCSAPNETWHASIGGWVHRGRLHSKTALSNSYNTYSNYVEACPLCLHTTSLVGTMRLGRMDKLENGGCGAARAACCNGLHGALTCMECSG